MKGPDRVGNRQPTVYQKARAVVKKIMSILKSFTLPRGPVVRLLRTALVLGRQDREQSVGVYRNWLQAVDVALDTWPITPDNDYVIRNAQTGQICMWLSHVPGLESDHCVLTCYYADELLYSERYSIKLTIQANGKGCTQITWIRTEI